MTRERIEKEKEVRKDSMASVLLAKRSRQYEIAIIEMEKTMAYFRDNKQDRLWQR